MIYAHTIIPKHDWDIVPKSKDTRVNWVRSLLESTSKEQEKTFVSEEEVKILRDLLSDQYGHEEWVSKILATITKESDYKKVWEELKILQEILDNQKDYHVWRYDLAITNLKLWALPSDVQWILWERISQKNPES